MRKEQSPPGVTGEQVRRKAPRAPRFQGRLPTQLEALQQVREVEVDRSLRAGTQPSRRYQDRCYERAGKYLLYHGVPGIRLVHGRYHVGRFDQVGYPDGFGHAWVELPGNIVFDGVEQRFFDKDSYYAAFSVRVVASWELIEAARLISTRGTWGPWDSDDERTTETGRGVALRELARRRNASASGDQSGTTRPSAGSDGQE